MKPIIEVKNISKKYRKGEKQLYYSLRDTISGILKNPTQNIKPLDNLQKNEFWALKNISFSVQKGEVLGIIGKNGAGKSTLLKVLSRITTPTSGEAILRGRVGSLLEVGTGFHQELTGKENIFLSGVILGMTRSEVEDKLEKIIKFAEVEEFIDTPIKHYSSGMRLRLAFSVAAHLQPEILLVDEVLSVGDADFQRKSLKKMSNVANQGQTLILVSHDMTAIQNICQKTLHIENGKVKNLGLTNEVVEQYLSTTQKQKSQYIFPKLDKKEGQINQITLYTNDKQSSIFDVSQPFRIKINYQLNHDTPSAELKIIFRTPTGRELFATSETHFNKPKTRSEGKYTSTLTYHPQGEISFNSNDYELLVKLERRGQVIDQQDGIHISFLDQKSKVAPVNKIPRHHNNELAFLPEWKTKKINPRCKNSPK